MESVTIELTKEEAQLLPLLYKVPINATLEGAPQMMRHKLLVDGLLSKVQKAFAAEPVAPAVPGVDLNKPKRKRH